MDSIRQQYLNQLQNKALSYLTKEYPALNEINLDSFELVNSYLIHQAIENNLNTHFQLPQKNYRKDYHVPTLLMLAISTFIKNWVENEYEITVGDKIIDNKGKILTIARIENGIYKCSVKGGTANTMRQLSEKQVRRYGITNQTLHTKRVNTNLETYRNFFINLLGCKRENIPYKFPNKTLVVASKKSIDEFKKLKIEGLAIGKAFPFQYIWEKRGSEIGKENNIPIEPMIYIVNNFDVAREHLLQNNDNQIDNIVFIGSQKYRETAASLTNILNDCQVKSCVLIGKESIGSLPQLHRWRWNASEIMTLNNQEIPAIEEHTVENVELQLVLEKFNQVIQWVEADFEVNLSGLNQFLRKITSQIVPFKNSDMVTYFQEVNQKIKIKCQTIIREAFHEMDYYGEEFEESLSDFNGLIEELSNAALWNFSKMNKLFEIQKDWIVHYLVVSKPLKAYWEKELPMRFSHKIQAITFSEYQNLQIDKTVRVVFLNYFGKLQLEAMLKNAHRNILILHNHQEELFQFHLKKHHNETLQEIQSEWRKKLAGFTFELEPEKEEVSDLIRRLADLDKNQERQIYDSEAELSYELIFESTQKKQVSNQHTFWVKTKNSIEEISVLSLEKGHVVLEYQNKNKQELYELALSADENGVFTKIESLAKLWREELKNDFKNSIETWENYFTKFKNSGLSISEPTFRHWFQSGCQTKFPQKDKDLKVIQQQTNSDLLKEKMKDLIRHKEIHKSIMISLGHGLSDEIFYYQKYRKVGKLLNDFSPKQIQRIIDENVTAQTVREIKLINTKQDDTESKKQTVFSKSYF